LFSMRTRKFLRGGILLMVFGSRSGGLAFLGLEADVRAGLFGWGLQKGEEFPVKVAQGGIVEEQRVVDFREALEDGGVGGEGFALFDEGAEILRPAQDRFRRSSSPPPGCSGYWAPSRRRAR